MTRAHPTLLPSGRLIVPLHTDAFSASIMAISDDLGETWITSEALVGFGNIQPSVVRKEDGTLVAMMRENGSRDRIRISESSDEGLNMKVRLAAARKEIVLPNDCGGLMMKHSWGLAALLVAVAAGAAGGSQMNAVDAASKVLVATGKRASMAEQEAAKVLAARIARGSDVACSVATEDAAVDGSTDLIIYLGLIENHDALATLCAKRGVAAPTAKDPGPEGFAAKAMRDGDRGVVLAAGVDERGVLYAAGEIWRRIAFNDRSIALEAFDVRTAPAFRIRGGQGHGNRTNTFDLIFAGMNCFYAGGEFHAFLKSINVMTVPGIEVRPNELQGDYPPEWQATEPGNWVCPSIPEARKALIEQWSRLLAPDGNSPWSLDHDVLRFAAGDPGGCRCPKCEPWGKQFVLLCEELGQIYLKYHPNAKLVINNQDLDNAGDLFIFDYLNQEPRTWLYGICYAPGSNAMSRYFRRELREDLFAYPGHGPINRYLREILNNIPKHQRIVHMSDITHWISSQYQVENPEPHLVAVYGRRTFHHRPRAMYRIFQAIMPFAEGDIVYSEGYQDEFHQYLWQRLLWDPNRSLEQALMEYCRLYYGPQAAPDMFEAMLQLEQNLEAPLATNEGIDRYYVLVKSAGWKLPARYKRDNHRWMAHMQKAALDKYVQLKLRRELELQRRAMSAIEQALAARDAEPCHAAALILDEPVETPEMTALREEAERSGRESEALPPEAGGRFVLLPERPQDVGPAYKRRRYRLDQDFVGLAWMRKQVQSAQQAPPAERRRLLEDILHYEDPGPGGFYDDAGDPRRQPHLVNGRSYQAGEYMDPTNRPSQNTIAYSTDDGKGVAFRYTGLDPAARYMVRLTMVAPRQPGSQRWAEGAKQHVVADGEYLAKDVEVPQYTAQRFEYDVPQSATADGELELWLEKGPGGWATGVSEVWLVKKR